MSWAVLTSGSKAEVRAEVAKQFDATTPGYSKCVEPEETLRQAAGALALAAIDANSDTSSIGVSCNGSASSDVDRIAHSVTVSVSVI